MVQAYQLTLDKEKTSLVKDKKEPTRCHRYRCLFSLTQHVSGISMPIIRRTDYVNNCMWSMPATWKNLKCSVETIW